MASPNRPPTLQFNLMACIEDRRQKYRREVAQQQRLQVGVRWLCVQGVGCLCVGVRVERGLNVVVAQSMQGRSGSSKPPCCTIP